MPFFFLNCLFVRSTLFTAKILDFGDQKGLPNPIILPSLVRQSTTKCQQLNKVKLQDLIVGFSFSQKTFVTQNFFGSPKTLQKITLIITLLK